MYITWFRVCIRGLILGSIIVIILSRPSWLKGHIVIVHHALSAFHDSLIAAIIAKLMYDIYQTQEIAQWCKCNQHTLYKKTTPWRLCIYVQPFIDIQILIHLAVFLLYAGITQKSIAFSQSYTNWSRVSTSTQCTCQQTALEGEGSAHTTCRTNCNRNDL